MRQEGCRERSGAAGRGENSGLTAWREVEVEPRPPVSWSPARTWREVEVEPRPPVSWSPARIKMSAGDAGARAGAGRGRMDDDTWICSCFFSPFSVLNSFLHFMHTKLHWSELHSSDLNSSISFISFLIGSRSVLTLTRCVPFLARE